MIHKLLAGKGKMKRGLSLLLCLALLGSSVISSNVTAEAESDVTVEAVETSETEGEIVSDTAEEVMAASEEDALSEEETETVTEAAEETGADLEPTEEISAGIEEAVTEAPAEETAEEVIDTTSETVETVTEDSSADITIEQTAEETVSTIESTETISVENTETTSTVSTVAEETVYTGTVTINNSTLVTVEASAEAGTFPEGTTMSVTLLDAGDEEVEAALAESDVEYDGYVSLDISFFDVNGTEVEPEDGSVSVKISMDASLLGDDVDTSSLEVHHLTETSDGLEVETVADTADEVDGTVEAADDGSVAAEFTVESFSTFTITYTTQGYFDQSSTTYSKTVYLQYIDSDGNTKDIELNDLESVNASDQWQSIKDIASEIIDQVEELGYAYEGAHVGSATGDTFTYLRYSNNNFQYSNSSRGNNGTNLNSDIYLVFAAPLATFQGVDTSGIISISVYDYDQRTVNNNPLKFDGSDWTGNDGGVKQDIVNNVLNADGYPTLLGTATSLGNLFGSEADDYYENVVRNANYLFQIDDEGYYYYDSGLNYAKLDTSTGEFALYYVPRAGEAADPDFPLFLPFNTLLNKTGTNTNDYTGNDHFGESYEYYEIAPSNADYYFGMEISFTFLIGKDGQVIITDEEGNEVSEDMVFEFAGDDDVWVFIDDVLVLDMGGVHDNYEGSINFHTGDVYVEKTTSGTSDTTTIESMFTTAGETWDGGDYTTHTLKFFYMERGAGGSNCKIKFNLQTIPTGTINFQKELDYANVANASDIAFTFNAYVNYDGTGNTYEMYTGYYEVYDADDSKYTVKRSGTATDGVITLYDGEVARLISDDILATSQFYIVEVGATSDKYKVSVTGVTVTQSDETTLTEIAGVTTEKLTVSNNPWIVFKNTVAANNYFNLKIDKKMAAGQSSTDTFSMTVLIGGVAYTGSYDVYDSNDNRVDTLTATGKGVITLQAGQYAIITGLMGGSSIQVTETGLSDLYSTPTYNIRSESGSLDTNTVSFNGTAEGTAKEGKELGDNPQVEVTVTNTLNTTTIKVVKVVEGNMGDLNKDFQFTLQLASNETYYSDDLGVTRSDTGAGSLTASGDGYTFYLSNGENITITVPVGYTYTVAETSYASEGYTTTNDATDASNDGLSGTVASEGIITFTNTKYVSAPTGLTRDVAPYVAALAIALGGAVLMFVSRRRRV